MKLLFLGDFYFDYEYIPDEINVLSEYILSKGYSTVLNLEGALGNKGSAISKRGPNLRHSLKTIDVLKLLNTKCVCLANNHAMDYGGEALEDGLSLLRDASISYVGAGA